MRADEGAGARYRGDVVRRRLSSGRDEFFITVKRAAAAAWAAMSDRRHGDSIPPPALAENRERSKLFFCLLSDVEPPS